MHPAIPFSNRASDLLASLCVAALGITGLRNGWLCPEELLASGSLPFVVFIGFVQFHGCPPHSDRAPASPLSIDAAKPLLTSLG